MHPCDAAGATAQAAGGDCHQQRTLRSGRRLSAPSGQQEAATSSPCGAPTPAAGQAKDTRAANLAPDPRCAAAPKAKRRRASALAGQAHAAAGLDSVPGSSTHAGQDHVHRQGTDRAHAQAHTQQVVSRLASAGLQGKAGTAPSPARRATAGQWQHSGSHSQRTEPERRGTGIVDTVCAEVPANHAQESISSRAELDDDLLAELPDDATFADLAALYAPATAAAAASKEATRSTQAHGAKQVPPAAITQRPGRKHPLAVKRAGITATQAGTPEAVYWGSTASASAQQFLAMLSGRHQRKERVAV